jgi:flagellar hook-basal body complex protein FliE
MSDLRINELLSQMRALKAQAQGKLPNPEALQGTQTQNGFANLLKNSIDSVNRQQQQAAQLAQAFETGDSKVDLSEVMVSLQKANVSFQAMTQVRNKLVSAYQEIMNMPV